MKAWYLNIKSNIESKSLLFGLMFMIVSLLIQANLDLDLYVGNLFYNFQNHEWFLHNIDPSFKFKFYTLPKVILILASLVLVFSAIKNKLPRKGLRIALFIFCMVFIPAVVSFLKSVTQIHCPYDLLNYTGAVPFRSVFDFGTYVSSQENYGSGSCFPGGHASGGYAFMSSCLVLPDLYRSWGIGIGFILGTYMAVYQMINGAHFLSHGLYTLGFSIVVISSCGIVLKKC